ncbi:cell division control protein 4 [Dentipellis sp. KUC8613]|nr:cell division control protein 4 [Dentipellis sp. KUC8613]
MDTRWATNENPKRISRPVHGRAVVTCLLISHGRIITASDDHMILVHSLETGEQLLSLTGHEGGVWSLAATKDLLVSGSTDRSVRVWDLLTGRCTHAFGGHTSTVRCVALVKPEWVDVKDEAGQVRQEKWPKRSMIVTGSRDHGLRVWTLPRPGEPEYKSPGIDGSDGYSSDDDVEDNPFHKLHLEGHEHAVRGLAARGRTIVSGSYDCTVRVWDLITGECRWVLVGHTQKVYSVVLDPRQERAYSGSMDGTVRMWDLHTGECLHTLTGHTSLVGLLGLSPSHLVSAAADATVRVWDPTTGELQHLLGEHFGAITCCQNDDSKVVSGADGVLKLWDIQTGAFVRDILTDVIGVWQVAFKGRWCVATYNRRENTYMDIWDFGPGEQGDEELEVSDDDA